MGGPSPDSLPSSGSWLPDSPGDTDSYRATPPATGASFPITQPSRQDGTSAAAKQALSLRLHSASDTRDQPTQPSARRSTGFSTKASAADNPQPTASDASAFLHCSPAAASAAAEGSKHQMSSQAEDAYNVTAPDSASESGTPRLSRHRSSGISQALTGGRLSSDTPGSPSDVAATLAVRPSQRAQQLFRQDSFDRECQEGLHSSRCIMGRINPSRRLTPGETKDLIGAMDHIQICLEGALARHSTWLVGCQSWEHALLSRLQGAERVVAKACLARQEARGELSLSRARQAANEASLAEKDAEIAQLSRKVCQLEHSSRELAQGAAADHFDTSSWLQMLCHD